MYNERKSITIKIDPIGNAKVEANGFNGQGCEAATKGIEEALAGGAGGSVRTYKPEFESIEVEQAETLHW